MTTNLLALPFADRWHGFWHGTIGEWILTRGLRITLLVLGGLLAARFINWSAQKISRRIDADFRPESFDATPSELRLSRPELLRASGVSSDQVAFGLMV